MIITDKFVFVHDPKTGGSFVTTALFRLYGINWTRWTHLKLLVFQELKYKTKLGDFIHTSKKHFGCRFIPKEYVGKKVLATVRNPLDWYVSQYEFGSWKFKEMKKYFEKLPNFEKDFAHFPELTFAEFVTLANQAFEVHLDCPREIQSQFGMRTRAFADFYFKEPGRALTKMLDEKYITSGAYKSDLYKNLHFIRTKNLNRNLHDFLLQAGYDKKNIDFILEMKKVLPLGRGRTKEQKWEEYYTPELKHEIRRKERILFQMFPEFDA